MDESERLQRRKKHRCYDDESDGDLDKEDEELSNRIASLLNHPKIDKYCMVDAYYYDFSVIPDAVREVLDLCHDSYLIFGITVDGQIVSKWVARWDLDSCNPIVDGKVIHSDKLCDDYFIPEINQYYNPKLLSTPMANLSDIFGEFGK